MVLARNLGVQSALATWLRISVSPDYSHFIAFLRNNVKFFSAGLTLFVLQDSQKLSSYPLCIGSRS
jgi:hypothetical protein